MRLHERQQPMEHAKTLLHIKLNEYQQERKIEDVEWLRHITFEAREILLDMEPNVSRADRYSNVKDLIRDHKAEHEMTDVEVLQGLFSYCSEVIKFMLRLERHGNYEKPAGEA